MLPTLGGFLIPVSVHPTALREWQGKAKGSSCWPRWCRGQGLARNSSWDGSAAPRMGTPGTRHLLGVPRLSPPSPGSPPGSLNPPPKSSHPEGSPLLWEQGPQGEAAPPAFRPKVPKVPKEGWHLPPPLPLCVLQNPCSPGGAAPTTSMAPKPLGGVSPLSKPRTKPCWHHPDFAVLPWSPSFLSEQRAPGTGPAQPELGHRGLGKPEKGLRDEQRGRKGLGMKEK